MKRIKTILAIVVFLSFLVSCRYIDSGGNDIQAETLPTSSSTKATRTIQPTNTVDPLAATLAFQATATSKADEILEAEKDTFSMICEKVHSRDFSPNHQWLAITCDYSINRYLEIVNHSGQRQIVRFSDYLSEDDHKQLDDSLQGYWEGGVDIVEWSKDNKYLYFSTFISIDADGPCMFGQDVYGLYRMDLEQGDVDTIFYTEPYPFAYTFAFSPNGQWLAYSKNQPIVLDLETGRNYLINFKGGFGDLAWSPDSTEFAFSYCGGGSNSAAGGVTTVDISSINSPSIKTILLEDDIIFSLNPKDDFLQIRNYSAEWGSKEYYYIYDWTTNELTRIESFPEP